MPATPTPEVSYPKYSYKSKRQAQQEKKKKKANYLNRYFTKDDVQIAYIEKVFEFMSRQENVN